MTNAPIRIATIVGARPQFIKAAMVSRAIRDHNSTKPLTLNPSPFTPINEVIIHTGQHYDYEMSQVFFDQLDLPKPDYHLEIGSGTHGDQTGRMMIALEEVLMKEKPDWVLVYGDTNSTLAGALAAAKLHIPVGHVEAGLRSFNRRMPEEINRVLTDHVAKWHFCPTKAAVKNLKNEGVTEGVQLVGDVMYDAVMLYKDIARKKSDVLQRLKLIESVKGQRSKVKGKAGPLTVNRSLLTTYRYALATIHRAENTDDPSRLRNILDALAEIAKEVPVVLPLHPRTKKAIEKFMVKDERLRVKGGFEDGPFTLNHLPLTGSFKIIDPVSYLDMIQLESHASVILTDSGGMQKEAYWLGVPCVTLRDETEWVETVEAGWNRCVGANKTKIVNAFREVSVPKDHPNMYGDGDAGEKILECL